MQASRQNPGSKPPAGFEEAFRLHLLGDFDLQGADGRSIPIPTKKNRALLAVLALSPGGRMTRERLCGLLWSDRGEEQARSSLRQSLATLRKELGAAHAGIIQIRDDQIALQPLFVDRAFVAAAAQAGDVESLRQAASLLRGELLADTVIRDEAFETWLASERRTCADASVVLLEKLVMAEGGPDRVVHAKRLVAIDPFSETAHRLLMQAYADNGERALALNQYEECRRVLKNEFGVEPSGATVALRRAIAKDGDLNAAELPRERDAKESIIVLPFTLADGASDQTFVGQGIAEDLTHALTKLRGLSVKGWGQSQQVSMTGLTPAEVMAQSGARYIVEGNVAWSGQRVRIACRLVEAPGGTRLWSENFDRDSGQVFAIQAEIALAVAHSLSVTPQPDERLNLGKRHSDSSEAYYYYLKGRDLQNRYTRPSYHLAQRMYRKAIELDPAFARAYAGMVFCYCYLSVAFDEQIPSEAHLTYSAEALALDGRLAEAHAARAFALVLAKKSAEARISIDKALQLDPDLYEALFLQARLASGRGDNLAAADSFERALAARPGEYQPHLLLYQAYLSLGRKVDAEAVARRGIGLAQAEIDKNPENPRPYYLGAATLAALGDVDGARHWARRALEIAPDDRLTLYNIACMHCALHEAEAAIDLLERALPTASRGLYAVAKRDSDLDLLRAMPRFQALMQALDKENP